MSPRLDLAESLRRLDGRSYPAYRDLVGPWELEPGRLVIEHVQGDPFAAPSRVRLEVDSGIPETITADPVARLAAEDWLLRRFGAGLRSSKRGSGRSGQLTVYRPGPEICERSAVRLSDDGVAFVRFRVGMPARGRRIDGRAAVAMFETDVRAAARLLEVGADAGLLAHVRSVQRQHALRDQLGAHGLVGFIADGSMLPRASGATEAPLKGAVPFRSPPSLRVELDTPAGPVTGMGIPRGVTVITGGGFHGKSTVLAALQRGHLDHVPGDGREGVVTVKDTVKIRAEDGRSVCRVDISAFLSDLPGGIDTRGFSTTDASGSTSQAAAIIEAIEAGASVLLFDEDTSATNLMVRDARMASLIPDEPITPLVQRVRELAEHGVSTVWVVGGVADALGVADTVIVMSDWQASEQTGAARALVPDAREASTPMALWVERRPAGLGGRGDRVRARDTRQVEVAGQEIVLTAVEQVLDGAHAATIGQALRLLESVMDGRRTVAQLLDWLDAVLDDEGVEALSPWDEPPGDLVRPRRHEVAAALARARGLMMNPDTQPGPG